VTAPGRMTMEFAAAAPADEEAAVLAVRPSRSLVEWAEQVRVLDAKRSAIPGPFDWSVTPYLREPAEAISDRRTRAITFIKCSQSGVSELWSNVVGWTADERPRPVMVVMPTEDDARERIARLKGMFGASPSLLGHVGGQVERINVGGPTELDRMMLYTGWARSAAALGDVAVCVMILDEIDKYPLSLPREGDPVSLAEKRMRTYRLFGKRLASSTPTDQHGRICLMHAAGDCREWYGRCPHCGGYRRMRWSCVELDKGPDGHLLEEAAYAAGGRARYRCPNCRTAWNEAERWRAAREGRWAPSGNGVADDGTLTGEAAPSPHRSYHVSALMLHPAWSTIDEMAASFAAARRRQKAGDAEPMKAFINSELGEIWTEAEPSVEDEQLAGHIEAWAADETAAADAAAMGRPVAEAAVGLPEGVDVITAGVDVQDDHFWLAVWGWGAGLEGWLLAAERIETDVAGRGPGAAMDFEPIAAALQRRWRPAAAGGGERAGRGVGISLTLMDTQWRTEQAYEFCAGFTAGECWPAQGADDVRDRLMTPSDLRYSRSPRRRRILQAAKLKLWRVSTLRAKSHLARLMNTPRAGGGYLHLPANTTDETIRQLASEELSGPPRRNRRTGRIERRPIWMLKKDHDANHLLDGSYLALAAARHIGAGGAAGPPAGGPRRQGVIGRYRRAARRA